MPGIRKRDIRRVRSSAAAVVLLPRGACSKQPWIIARAWQTVAAEQVCKDCRNLAAQTAVDAGWNAVRNGCGGDDLQAVSLDDLDSLRYQLGAFDQGQLAACWIKAAARISPAPASSLLARYASRRFDLRAWLGAVRTAENSAAGPGATTKLAAH